MPTIRYLASTPTDIAAATPSVTAKELAFFNRPETRAWWEAVPGKGQSLPNQDYWEDRKGGFRLVPANPGVKPSSLGSGGPDGAPIVQSLSTGAVPDTLVTMAGQVVVPTGSFCLWAVAKAGTNSTATVISIVGNNGGSLSLRMRDGNYIDAQIKQPPPSGFLTRVRQNLSAAVAHLVQLNYNHVTHEISIWADGALLSGLTPASGKFSYTHGFPSSRVSVLGEYDLGAGQGDLGVFTRNLPITQCGVATTHAPDNAAWQTALKQMVAEKYPSLVLA